MTLESRPFASSPEVLDPSWSLWQGIFQHPINTPTGDKVVGSAGDGNLQFQNGLTRAQGIPESRDPSGADHPKQD